MSRSLFVCIVSMMILFSNCLSFAEETSWPIKLTDDVRRVVTIEKPAKRIVAGSSMALELLMAIDQPPVLRPDVAREKVYPAKALEIPTVAIQHGSGPDMETILAAKPDLIILHTAFTAFASGIEKAAGCPVLILDVGSVADVETKLLLLGQITDQQKKAQAAAQDFRTRLETVKEKKPESVTSPKVLALFGTPDAFYAFRNESYVGSMLQELGATNITTGEATVNRMRAIAPVELEQVIAANPDYIVVVPHGGSERVEQYLNSHAAWKQIPAVKKNHVYMLDEVLFMSNPGPRAVEAMKELSTLFYPAVASKR